MISRVKASSAALCPGRPAVTSSLNSSNRYSNRRTSPACPGPSCAKATQAALRVRGVAIADEVQAYGDFLVGSFLDSEGNKLWFCSPVNG